MFSAGNIQKNSNHWPWKTIRNHCSNCSALAIGQTRFLTWDTCIPGSTFAHLNRCIWDLAVEAKKVFISDWFQNIHTYRPVSTFWDLEGQNSFFEGHDFCFYYVFLRQSYLGTRKFEGAKKKFGGSTAQECPTWLRACIHISLNIIFKNNYMLIVT